MNMAVSISNIVKSGEVISFKSNKNTEKFEQGYVQSSQLYRREVYPFLSDAARHVYFELESRIHGYQKLSDYVSYSQLQTSGLENSRKISRSTISKGITELAEKGVITILSTCTRRGNKYQINEVSLLQKQDRVVQNLDCTSPKFEPLAVQNLDTQKKEKEIFKENKKKDWFDLKKLEKHVLKRNEILGTSIALKQLTDATWYKYEFEQFEQYNANNQVTDDLKHSYLATWLLNAYTKYEKDTVSKNKQSTSDQKEALKQDKKPVFSEKTNFDSRVSLKDQTSLKTQNKSEKRERSVVQPMKSLSQIRLFAKKLAEYKPFASKHAEVGEQEKDFKNRLLQELGNPSFVEKYIQDLKEVGYASYA